MNAQALATTSVPCTFAHWRTIYKLMLFYTLLLVPRSLSLSVHAIVVHTYNSKSTCNYNWTWFWLTESARCRCVLVAAVVTVVVVIIHLFSIWFICILPIVYACDRSQIYSTNVLSTQLSSFCSHHAYRVSMSMNMCECVCADIRVLLTFILYSIIFCVFACKKMRFVILNTFFPGVISIYSICFAVFFYSSLCYFFPLFLIICSSIYSLWYGQFCRLTSNGCVKIKVRKMLFLYR